MANNAVIVGSRSCPSTGFVCCLDFAICGWWRWRMWLWRPSLLWNGRGQWLHGTNRGRETWLIQFFISSFASVFILLFSGCLEWLYIVPGFSFPYCSVFGKLFPRLALCQLVSGSILVGLYNAALIFHGAFLMNVAMNSTEVKKMRNSN